MKKYATLIAATALSANAATIVPVGDAIVDRGSVDGWGGLFVDQRAIDSGTSDTQGTITDVTFWVNRAAAAGHIVVPLLLANDGTDITVIGVGAELSGFTLDASVTAPVTAASGTFSFDTSTPGITYHQGIAQWDPNNADSRSNDGLVAYDNTPDAGAPGWDAGNNDATGGAFNENPIVGDIFQSDGQSGRGYSYQSTINFVPEPSGMALVMLAGIFGIGRRRR